MQKRTKNFVRKNTNKMDISPRMNPLQESPAFANSKRDRLLKMKNYMTDAGRIKNLQNTGQESSNESNFGR